MLRMTSFAEVRSMKIVRLAMVTGFLVALSLSLTSVQAQDKKKGALPANFGKLGLSDEQKQKVYSIQAKYKTEKDDLNKKLKKVTDDQNAEVFGVLTPDQKEKLKELTSFEKTEKKKDEKVATLIKCLQSNQARENERNKIDMIVKPTEVTPTLKICGFDV
jgi:hypothetical protein